MGQISPMGHFCINLPKLITRGCFQAKLPKVLICGSLQTNVLLLATKGYFEAKLLKLDNRGQSRANLPKLWLLRSSNTPLSPPAHVLCLSRGHSTSSWLLLPLTVINVLGHILVIYFCSLSSTLLNHTSAKNGWICTNTDEMKALIEEINSMWSFHHMILNNLRFSEVMWSFTGPGTSSS